MMGPQGPYSNPQMAAMAAMAHMPMVQLPPSNNPRFFFDIATDGKRLGRAIIEVQAALSPRMAQNFHMLVTSEKGFGYRGCQFFQAWRNESVICGDWEHNSGRGGRAALDEGPLFTPDETKLPCIRGAVGMRRMSKKHSSLNQVWGFWNLTFLFYLFEDLKKLIFYNLVLIILWPLLNLVDKEIRVIQRHFPVLRQLSIFKQTHSVLKVLISAHFSDWHCNWLALIG